ncbi:VOC family protein [Parachitinimonas caeni]|uniref:VOC family protein n=1 Tax=Parachitinimonas caeni TaxID=3031301 RepID=A0ABT7E017_9NEIS|nr:VOC family protein [Parachitinimonas caeni]MDK2125424.1 VOC family protein [Parachitinimonas caeni]
METLTTPHSQPALASIQDLILELDHVAIAVEDLDAAVAWHSRALGFTEVSRRVTTGEHTAMRSAVMKAGKAVVVLVQGMCEASQVSQFIARHGQGVQHVALAVSDLDRAVASLEANGIVMDTPMIVDHGIRQVFLGRTPDSEVRYELIERRGGAFTDRSVERLFRTLEAGKLY